MKVTIDVEQFDNGITLKWKNVDGNADQKALVVLDREKETVIGKMIWSGIEKTMNLVMPNKIKMEITYLLE